MRLLGWGGGADRAREFEEVALVHLDALHRSALRLTHNRPEAEDLVQETFLRAFRSFHRFNPGTNCRAWLFTIHRNAFLNRIRQGSHEVLEDDPAAWEAASESGTQPHDGGAGPAEGVLPTGVLCGV